MNEKEFLERARKEAPRRGNGKIDYRAYAKGLMSQLEIMMKVNERLEMEIKKLLNSQ